MVESSINMSTLEDHIDLISRALVEVSPDYFKLATTYEPDGIVRERVFCYELYHQIRILMGKDYLLSLNGEIDKRGHVDFDEADRKNPDFVFHIPGTHHGNTIAIEVKGRLDDPAENIKDFKTVSTFVGKYNYQAGLVILYNHTSEELFKKIGDDLLNDINNEVSSKIYVMSIAEPGAEVERLRLSEAFPNNIDDI